MDDKKVNICGQLSDSLTGIIVPAKTYDVDKDKRLLIPFIQSLKVGFVNRQGKIIVEPKYDTVLGDCYSESDYIKVGITDGYAYERKNKEPEVYIRKKWGLINYRGESVVEPLYSGISLSENAIIVRRAYGRQYDGAYALLNKNGEMIIPFGRYSEIAPFVNGLARCCILQNSEEKKTLYGIINENGEEVLKCNERFINWFSGKNANCRIVSVKEHLKKENPDAYKQYFPDDVITKTESEILHDNYQKYIDSFEHDKIQMQKQYGRVTVVELKNGEYGVMKDDRCIVPFGKYGWIDRYDNGLTRVRTNGKLLYQKNILSFDSVFGNEKKSEEDTNKEIHDKLLMELQNNPRRFAKWGIIDDEGKEVVPLIYDEIWNFYGKNRTTTNAVINGENHVIDLCNLKENSNSDNTSSIHNSSNNHYTDNYGSRYGEFAGSYAQDVEGYSDDVINDAFEGDADAYWNID